MRRLLASVVLIAMTAAGCRETGDVQVTSIKFNGANAVQADELKGVLATQESGFLPWSRKRFFDRPEFDRDVKRIEAFYADRGYPRAKVVGVDVALNDAKDKVAITVEINEGEPTIIEKVIFDGFDGVPADHLERLQARLPIAASKPRDQRLILASHDMSVAELRDHGFPYGNVRMVERPGSNDMRVELTVAADTGPQAVFGAITVEGDVSVDEDVIRRELAFKEGDLYQLSRITETQRRLYSLELFQFANVVPRLPEDRSPQVPVVVTVAEGQASAPPAGGWVRFRGEGARTHQLAARELRRWCAHWRGRGEGVVARAGGARQFSGTVPVSARAFTPPVGIHLVGRRAGLRVPKQRREDRADQGFQPREHGRRAWRPQHRQRNADSGVRGLHGRAERPRGSNVSRRAHRIGSQSRDRPWFWHSHGSRV